MQCSTGRDSTAGASLSLVGAAVERKAKRVGQTAGPWIDEAAYVESFVILNAAGGECLDDFAHLRKDAVGELGAPVAEPGGGAKVSLPVP